MDNDPGNHSPINTIHSPRAYVNAVSNLASKTPLPSFGLRIPAQPIPQYMKNALERRRLAAEKKKNNLAHRPPRPTRKNKKNNTNTRNTSAGIYRPGSRATVPKLTNIWGVSEASVLRFRNMITNKQRRTRR